MALWGGRFESGPDALFRAINDSLGFDYRLALEDIDGSLAWAKAIHGAGVLDAGELDTLSKALAALRAAIVANPRLPLEEQGDNTHDEDIHSYVERKLVEKLGPLGKKLHTGRSRNDQVATDLRLWTRRAIDTRLAELRDARRALIDIAQRESTTVTSGYTHLQRAQPVLFAHWALAYQAMLARDAARLRDCRTRVNICPLGSGALAGTAYKIDRHALAKDLGFEAASTNSLDATSDRDFVIETLSCLATLGVHLSRLGEDLILFGSQEFGLVEFHDSVSSGSSLMPQKKNPDAAELLRGKSGRVIGSLVSMFTSMKGLPLAYNKDLQEDKEPLFDAMDQASVCLRVVPKILDTLKVNRAKCEAAAKGGYSNATDLADYLVAQGVPFREAHEQAGKAVRLALSHHVALDDLSLEQLKTVAPKCEADVFPRLSLNVGLAARNVFGGTGPDAVREALAQARASLDESN